MNEQDTTQRPTALASHHMRLFALMFDYFLIVSLLKVIDQVSAGDHWDLLPVPETPEYFSPMWLLGLVILVLGKDLIGGRSLGKWLTGITIVSASDATTPATSMQTVLRNMTLVLLPVEGILVFVDGYYRRLGDRLAGTVVVAAPRVPPTARRWTVITAFFMALLLSSLVIGPWNMRRSAAHQTAISTALQMSDLARAIGTPLVLEDTKQFDLSMAPDEGRAVVTLSFSGPKGERDATLTLRLRPALAQWEVQEQRLVPLKKQEKSNAQPRGTTTAPKVQDAPPKPSSNGD